MGPIFGKRVVISIPPTEDEVSELMEPEVPTVSVEMQELEAEHAEGIAGHAEIRSLQQWLDLNG